MNINNPTTFSPPDLTLSTSNSSGTAGALRADDTLKIYDATVPSPVSSVASAGDTATAARRNHVHIGVSGAASSVDNTIARYSGTAGALQGYTSGGPTISDTGVMLKTAQPAILYTLNSANANITGAGTAADLSFDTKVFDQGDNFSDPTFTAPVGGRYLFLCSTKIDGCTDAMTRAGIFCITSNRTWILEGVSPGAMKDVYGSCKFMYSAIADLDINDTLKMQLTIYNGAGDTVDQGSSSSSVQSSLSICLLA